MKAQAETLRRLTRFLDTLSTPCLKSDILRHVAHVGATDEDLQIFRAVADTVLYHSREQILRALSQVLRDHMPRT